MKGNITNNRTTDSGTRIHLTLRREGRKEDRKMMVYTSPPFFFSFLPSRFLSARRTSRLPGKRRKTNLVSIETTQNIEKEFSPIILTTLRDLQLPPSEINEQRNDNTASNTTAKDAPSLFSRKRRGNCSFCDMNVRRKEEGREGGRTEKRGLEWEGKRDVKKEEGEKREGERERERHE